MPCCQFFPLLEVFPTGDFCFVVPPMVIHLDGRIETSKDLELSLAEGLRRKGFVGHLLCFDSTEEAGPWNTSLEQFSSRTDKGNALQLRFFRRSFGLIHELISGLFSRPQIYNEHFSRLLYPKQLSQHRHFANMWMPNMC